MKFNILYFIVLVFINSSLIAQSSILHIGPDIELPKDSIESAAILTAVNGFLSAAQGNSENKWVLTSEDIETQLLIDEIEGIQKNEELEHDHFFKPYLTNIILQADNNYAVHVAYIGVHEGIPNLRANFELVAHKSDNTYAISSPLQRNTESWKTEKIQNQVFHYPYNIDSKKIQRYYELTSSFDKKLKNNDKETHYYLVDNEVDPLQLSGIAYKSDYNSHNLKIRYGLTIENKSIFVLGTSKFYNYPEHDLWHFRLGQVISRREVHRRVDCHFATLYGGLWGMSWNELFPIFSEKFVIGNKVDWLKHKKESSHFLTNGRKNYTDDFIGALIVKKIENEKGFDAVWELLMTKRTKEEVEYFAMVEKLTGISKDNYNKKVFKLIKEEMDNLGLEMSNNKG